MHCMFPNYQDFYYNSPSSSLLNCEDKTDHVYKVNTSCTADTFITTYCQTFCPEGVNTVDQHGIPFINKVEIVNINYFINTDGQKVQRGYKCDSLCSNVSAWLADNSASTALVDPHH